MPIVAQPRSALTDATANALLDRLLGSNVPATVYVGLLLQEPAHDGTGVLEPGDPAYGRVGVANDGANWPAASVRQKTHALDVEFPLAGQSWGSVSHVGIFDAATAGTLLLFGPLDTARAVDAGDQFRFIAGSSPIRIVFPDEVIAPGP
jgi:hypothetical protein